MHRPTPEPVGPDQESVWDYPRPPALDPSTELVVVTFAGTTLAESRRPIRVLETSHAPVYYLPPEDVRMDLLVPIDRRTFCEFKGAAAYADAVIGDRRAVQACWWYATPSRRYAAIAHWIAFYPSRVDRITVDGEAVRPVGGDFYGSWVTSRVAGPFKGGPGTEGW
ncbi:MAG: DUF427 domain-containing protein [Trueperaceae bacterium]|nr:DUF427 domain-containing protein [Trueperaceae bacterium]